MKTTTANVTRHVTTVTYFLDYSEVEAILCKALQIASGAAVEFAWLDDGYDREWDAVRITVRTELTVSTSPTEVRSAEVTSTSPAEVPPPLPPGAVAVIPAGDEPSGLDDDELGELDDGENECPPGCSCRWDD